MGRFRRATARLFPANPRRCVVPNKLAKIAIFLALSCAPQQMVHAQNSDEEVVNNCAVQSIGALTDRVHILCKVAPAGADLSGLIYPVKPAAPSANATFYYAIENGPMANAVLTIASTAINKGRTLTIVYKSSASQNPSGCQANDCRRIVAVLLN